MGCGQYSGLVWGIAATGPEQEALVQALRVLRSPTHPRHELPEEKGGAPAARLYATRRPFVKQSCGDVKPPWIGAWVAVSTRSVSFADDCAAMGRVGPASRLDRLYAEEIERARARWEVYRAWCQTHLDLDPGPGELLSVYDFD